MSTDRAESTRMNRLQFRAFEDGLKEVARLNNLAVREDGNRSSWCGHNLLGKRPDKYSHDCPGREDGWWDHPRSLGRGRQQLVIMGWPYRRPEEVEPALSAYADRLGLRYKVGEKTGPLSFYFYGSAVPWVLAAPEIYVEAMFTTTSDKLEQVMADARRYAEWRDGQGTSPKARGA